jgi:hypothetical protein
MDHAKVLAAVCPAGGDELCKAAERFIKGS